VVKFSLLSKRTIFSLVTQQKLSIVQTIQLCGHLSRATALRGSFRRLPCWFSPCDGKEERESVSERRS